jgi:microcystin-dependent protein
MSNPFVGEIRCFGFNFAPKGWAMCNGQIMAISQNTALFSLLGTTYGGNGTSTFALPNLQSRVPVGQGQGPGLSDYIIGEMDGVESVTINGNEMPAHNHSLFGTTLSANDKRPKSGAAFATSTKSGPVSPGDNYYAAPGTITPLNAATVQPLIGGGLPHSNLQPYLTFNFCIALQGIFPARS